MVIYLTAEGDSNLAMIWIMACHPLNNNPDNKVHGANMGIWGRQDPGRPHVGPMNLAILETTI